MSRYEIQAYAGLRMVAGFLFLWHGSQKLFDIPPAGVAIPLFIKSVAGPIELVGGFLIMIGLWTRWAAFLASGLMACAYWIAHGRNALLPLVNQGEMAVLYCFLFLFISTRGSGVFSIDHYLQGRRQLGSS